MPRRDGPICCRPSSKRGESRRRPGPTASARGRCWRRAGNWRGWRRGRSGCSWLSTVGGVSRSSTPWSGSAIGQTAGDPWCRRRTGSWCSCVRSGKLGGRPAVSETSVPLDGAVDRLDLRESEALCRDLVRRAATNFYWGFIILPWEQRIAIYALYAFSRQVDDEADQLGSTGLRERLKGHRERVRRCMRGEYADPVMQVLAGVVRRFAIPESELLALIDGVEMDGYRTRYRTWDELREYCGLVASVIGRLCVRIFGFSGPAAF